MVSWRLWPRPLYLGAQLSRGEGGQAGASRDQRPVRNRLGDSVGQAWSFGKEGRTLISGPSLKGVLFLSGT